MHAGIGILLSTVLVLLVMHRGFRHFALWSAVIIAVTVGSLWVYGHRSMIVATDVPAAGAGNYAHR